MELFPIFLSFSSSFFLLIFGRFVGSFNSTIFSIVLIGFSFLFASYCFFKNGLEFQTTVLFPFGTWFELGEFKLVWLFQFDPLVYTMQLVVLLVSFLVHVYSHDYMQEDPHKIRFFGYLSLFTFFMLLLVTSGNFIQLFLGWEGVGVCSYLLISFWFSRQQALKSALKAIVVNRVGDIGLLLAMVFLYKYSSSLEFGVLFNLSSIFLDVQFYDISFGTILGFLLLFAAVGKSAQLGLHTWLPDAMEGPTPVSALIHAATMVTAGIFLLIRCAPLYSSSYVALSIICLFGAITAFFAGSVGLFQQDLKRIIAYSTASQLGFMTLACGLMSPTVAFFHLFTHAFFKALLFLAAGSVIHSCFNEQDLRKMGKLVEFLPSVYIFMLIGSFSLAGIPFLSGFYSKEPIIEIAFSNWTFTSLFSGLLAVTAVSFTTFYSCRLLYFSFFSVPSFSFVAVKNFVQPASVVILVFLILSVASIFSGYLFRDLMVGVGTDFYQQSVVSFPSPSFEFLPFTVKIVPFFMVFVGGIFSMTIFFPFWRSFNGRALFLFFNNRWFFDSIQNRIFSFPALQFGYSISFKLLDRGIIEIFGPTGIVRLVQRFVNFQPGVQTGYIYHYILFFLFGLIAYFSNFFYRSIIFFIIVLTCSVL